MTEQERRFRDWLESDCEHSDGFAVHERISFLVCANGSWIVRGWGFLSYDNHQRGLEQSDAIELINAHGYVSGISEYADFNPFEVFSEYFVRYLNKHNENLEHWGLHYYQPVVSGTSTDSVG